MSGEAPVAPAASGLDLPEVAEADATGEIARIYGEIRTALGLPLVNLIYRTLAAEPGRLEAVWAELGPNLAAPAVNAAADELVALAGAIEQRPLSAPVVAAVGVGAGGTGGTRAILETIAAYQHANPRNLVALSALVVGAPGGGSGAAATGTTSGEAPPGAPRPAFTTLPMARLDSIAPETRALLDVMAAPLIAPGDVALVPSLLRHFAHDPALLALLHTATVPAVAQPLFLQTAAAVESRARDIARLLPREVTRLPPGSTRDLVVRFTTTISRMVVYAELLRRALGA